MAHKRTFRTLAWRVLTLAVFLSGSPVWAQTIDLGFNGTGWVSYNEAGTLEYIVAVFEQPDGKVIAVAETNYDPDEGGNSRIVILRYNPDGTADNSWPGGKVYIDTPNSTDQARAAIQQPDGKILIAGTHGSSKGVVYRLNTNGTLDNSFGVGGKAVIAAESVYNFRNIKLQPNGKIVVSGNSFIDSRFSYILARFNADGTLDPSFNAPNGYIKFRTSTLSTEEDNGAGYGLDIHEPTGKIITCGFNEKEYGTVAKLLPNGTLDNSFSSYGRMVFPFDKDMFLYSVIVLNDGKILVGGYYQYGSSTPKAQILRLFENGNFDNSWAGSGIGWYGNPSGSGYSMLLQCDGKILIGGNDYLVRVLPNGMVDQTFASAGHFNFKLQQYYAFATTLHLSKNKIYLAGDYFNPPTPLDRGGFILRLNNTIDCSTVPTEEAGREIDFQVFPNPAQDLLSIQIGETTEFVDFSLTDNLGRTLISNNQFIQNGSLLQCDLSALPSGTYFAVVATTLGRRAVPVVKL